MFVLVSVDNASNENQWLVADNLSWNQLSIGNILPLFGELIAGDYKILDVLSEKVITTSVLRKPQGVVFGDNFYLPRIVVRKLGPATDILRIACYNFNVQGFIKA